MTGRHLKTPARSEVLRVVFLKFQVWLCHQVNILHYTRIVQSRLQAFITTLQLKYYETEIWFCLIIILYDTWGSHNAFAEYTSFPGCYTMLIGKQLSMFPKTVVCLSSGSNSPCTTSFKINNSLPVNSTTSQKTWTFQITYLILSIYIWFYICYPLEHFFYVKR